MEKPTNKEIGARLKEARVAAGLTLRQAAKVFKSGYWYVESIEDGEYLLHAANLPLFCKTYGVSTDWVLGMYTEDTLPESAKTAASKLKENRPPAESILHKFNLRWVTVSMHPSFSNKWIAYGDIERSNDGELPPNKASASGDSTDEALWNLLKKMNESGLLKKRKKKRKGGKHG